MLIVKRLEGQIILKLIGVRKLNYVNRIAKIWVTYV
jgi:hypothetical protein